MKNSCYYLLVTPQKNVKHPTRHHHIGIYEHDIIRTRIHGKCRFCQIVPDKMYQGAFAGGFNYGEFEPLFSVHVKLLEAAPEFREPSLISRYADSYSLHRNTPFS